MGKFSVYEYRKQPGFDMNTFEGANQAIPMKTLVIYCFDPRAADIPQAVAAHFGDEVYPGENILETKMPLFRGASIFGRFQPMPMS